MCFFPRKFYAYMNSKGMKELGATDWICSTFLSFEIVSACTLTVQEQFPALSYFIKSGYLGCSEKMPCSSSSISFSKARLQPGHHQPASEDVFCHLFSEWLCLHWSRPRTEWAAKRVMYYPGVLRWHAEKTHHGMCFLWTFDTYESRDYEQSVFAVEKWEGN